MEADPLILASSSPFRKALLERLGLPFRCQSPDVDETHFDGESPDDYVLRLAEAKADAVAASHQRAWVIGSDQCAVLDGEIIGKPGTVENAHGQLRRASGRRVTFHTGMALVHKQSGAARTTIHHTHVNFRALSEEEITRYVARDTPLGSAGSFKSEGLGISLFESIEDTDPTALIGLSLITIAGWLREAGFRCP